MVPAHAPNDKLCSWACDDSDGVLPIRLGAAKLDPKLAHHGGQERAPTIFPRGNAACVYGIRGCAKSRDTKLGLRSNLALSTCVAVRQAPTRSRPLRGFMLTIGEPFVL